MISYDDYLHILVLRHAGDWGCFALHFPCTYSALDWVRLVVETYNIVLEKCHIPADYSLFKKGTLSGDLCHAITCHGLVILALACHVELQNGYEVGVGGGDGNTMIVRGLPALRVSPLDISG